MTKKYLEPVSLGKLDDLYEDVSAMSSYTRIMRRTRRGVARTEFISDRTNIDIQQKHLIETKIETVREWLDAAEKVLL